ncbi:hypothetical protein ACFSQJ_07470 [Croceitalea marina]|uniref:Uncharacterized protein n=2 Tax=Croceitalea marina TaxID=1775166 RepID=A0ABW5MYL2_9FLAO
MFKDKSKLKRIVLYLSFLPLLIHIVQHFLAKSYFPLLFVLTSVILLIFLRKLKIVSLQHIIKTWSILITGHGIIRLALAVLVSLAGNSVPSQIYYQLDFWYFFISIVLIFLGFWLLMNRKQSPEELKTN